MSLAPRFLPSLRQFFKWQSLAFFFILFVFNSTQNSQATQVTLAGFSFGGDFATANERFPHTFKLFSQFNAEQKNKAGKSFSRLVLERANGVSNDAFTVAPLSQMANLKNDQTLMAVLVFTGETVVTEEFENYYKTFINLRADALIFDYKSKTVVRNYPLSVIVFDATNHPPSAAEISHFVQNLLLREDENGLVSQFVERLNKATLPNAGNLNLQIKNVEIAPEAFAFLPASLRNNPSSAKGLLADTFASIFSAQLGLPMLPASVNHTLGTMALRLENGDDFTLKIGEGDYLFDIKLNKFAKIKTGENHLGVSFVYGAYAHIHLYEPTQNTDFLKSDFKNGEVKTFPATQLTNDDFPSFEAALRGLFIKLTRQLEDNPKDDKWVKTAASATDISSQLNRTRDILKACK